MKIQALLFTAWCLLGNIQLAQSLTILRKLGLEDKVRSYVHDMLQGAEEIGLDYKEVETGTFGTPRIDVFLFDGQAGATSYFKPANRGPFLAFAFDEHWASFGNGKMPQAIWYNFKHPVKVEEFSFKSRDKTHKHFEHDGPSSYQFFGSNSPDCSDSTRWVVLYEDDSLTPFSNNLAMKSGQVNNPDYYICYGFNVMSVPGRPSGREFAVIRDIKFYGEYTMISTGEVKITIEERDKVGAMDEFSESDGGNHPHVQIYDVGVMDEHTVSEEEESLPAEEGDKVEAINKFAATDEEESLPAEEGDKVEAIDEFAATDEEESLPAEEGDKVEAMDKFAATDEGESLPHEEGDEKEAWDKFAAEGGNPIYVEEDDVGAKDEFTASEEGGNTPHGKGDEVEAMDEFQAVEVEDQDWCIHIPIEGCAAYKMQCPSRCHQKEDQLWCSHIPLGECSSYMVQCPNRCLKATPAEERMWNPADQSQHPRSIQATPAEERMWNPADQSQHPRSIQVPDPDTSACPIPECPSNCAKLDTMLAPIPARPDCLECICKGIKNEKTQ